MDLYVTKKRRREENLHEANANMTRNQHKQKVSSAIAKAPASNLVQKTTNAGIIIPSTDFGQSVDRKGISADNENACNRGVSDRKANNESKKGKLGC